LAHNKVELRCDERSAEILKKFGGFNPVPVTEADYYEEYLDLILAIKVVPSTQAAIDFINRYGSAHSDCIITDDEHAAAEFLNGVDSATVYWNASTRFTDGFEFGMGAEIGISTDKLHARGPMGLRELTTYKYVIYGNGQLRK
jgi:glutamate-5-semialdehyde dehydrogenase